MPPVRDVVPLMTNRLQHETSPYLQQHARNPVDWYPWGTEALALAKAQDRPIFLSIGYSACHWCHVMEHESFESEDIAALMNQWFINIKVDREERPDLDQIYMNAVTSLTGSGGWPMSVFLTPDLKPFYGGTYWPPTSRWGRPGFRDILEGVHDAWMNRREGCLNQAAELTELVVQAGQPSPDAVELSEETLRRAERSLIRAADSTHGGFGRAPKFPHPMDLRVLLRCVKRFGGDEALKVVRLTLDKMANGGIYDHLGGGFARYSTDERWLVPHFEKMLYDNAQLTSVYLEAFQLTGDQRYATVARETLDYVLREMTSPTGGFYSTQDADSEGVEGKFFVWSHDEIMQHLGPDDGRVFCAAYDVTPHGNWEHTNILNRPQAAVNVAVQFKLSPNGLEEILANCRQKLLAVREQRIHPGRDEKILVAWNGLMIAAMAQGANVLEDRRYADAATAAARFIIEKMTTDGHRLLHVAKDGVVRLNAYLDDYACLIDGLVELYQATFEPDLIDAAVGYAERMIAQFWDTNERGFFYTSTDHETLIARNKEVHDNATPSGNSMAATALVKLGRLTGRQDLEDRGTQTLDMMSGTMSRVAMAAGQALIAFDFTLGPVEELVFCPGNPNDNLPQTTGLHRRFIPNKLVLVRPSTVTDDQLPLGLRSHLAGKSSLQDTPALYACRAGTCRAPLTDLNAMRALWPTLTRQT